MSLLKKIPLLICLSVPALMLVAGNPQFTAQAVLDKLYKINGHLNPLKPKIEIVNAKQNVAVYIKAKNTIQLEEQAYQLCRSFGADSLNALAFIIGHELIHAIQTNQVLPKTSFISYDQSSRSSLAIEQDADIQGIFLSYLAGFKTIRMIPEIIEKMYTVYELRSKNIRGYPTETERKNAYKTVISQAGDLIELFDLSNQLTIIEEYEASILCLEYISKFYQGKEILNNLGINYTLQALNYTGRNPDLYIYPLELDWNTRFKKPKSGRGDEVIDPIEKLAQLQLYTRAKEYFKLAGNMDHLYYKATLNSFALLVIMGEYTQASEFYKKELRTLDRRSDQDFFQKIRLVYAILSAKQNKKTEAANILTELLQNNNPQIAMQAKLNLNALNQYSPLHTKKIENTCLAPDLNTSSVYQTKLRSVETEKWLSIDSFTRIERKQTHNTIFYGLYVNDRRILKLQKMEISDIEPLLAVKDKIISLGNNLWIYACKKEKEAYILNESMELVSVIRYHHYKEID
jgi:tetratricopeptide (TPR) repeat protein